MLGSPVASRPLNTYPCLRRYLENGFTHNERRDAPHHGMICLETPNQTLFVNPETGYSRVGRTVQT